MLEHSIGPIGGTPGYNSPIEDIAKSSIRTKSKEGEHERRGSFLVEIKQLGYDAR